ncbi:extracellular solute-binding protein [Blautia liquoris]|uniref:Extracellular solute-binding protein n=1 Tax=Blautia liquoris TaxID=2779518 RepID=A0A7M2REC2_9FIRM|nr:extracellular solute-binding protein [Blautia liquoris]QOV18683.1 extracellular solute-binding protein [Blautia liquoris]
MRKILKKVSVTGLTAVLSISMLAGCGSKQDDNEKKVELNKAGTYPIVKDGTINMTMFTMSMPNVEDFATNDFTEFMEKKTGIKMEFITGGRDDWSDKLNMILQSDDYPDIIFGVSPDIAKYGVKEGIIIPLDDYITEENVPNYLRVMKDYDMDITRETDGKIYSLAEVNDCYHCSYGRKLWVNKHHLDEMGVGVPTTTDEFMDVCKKFLEYKPDGIAVAGAEQGWFSRMQDWLMGAYTFIPSKSAAFTVRDFAAVNMDTDKIVDVATTDEYKEGLKFIKQLYDMGAIYDGNFTQTGEQMKTLVNQPDEPVLFFADGTISDSIDSVSNNELYRHYEAMAPIKGPDGTQIAWKERNSGLSSGGVCITDKCKNPEAALRWADFFYSETGDLSSQYGPEEGKDWELNPKGKVGMDGNPALYEVLNAYSAETQNHDWQDVGIRVAPRDYRMGQAMDIDVDPYSPEGLEKLLYDATKELYEPYGENTNLANIEVLKVTDEESTDMSTTAVEVSKLIDENAVAFMTGEKDIDSEWDKYLDALDKAGLPELIKTYQTAYDRMHSQSKE